jgi:transporter family-2 protein
MAANSMIGLALLVGLLIPFQGIVTASLSQKLEHPYVSAFINFFGGTLIFMMTIMFSSASFPTIKKLTTIPWYLYTGGIIGSLFIMGALFSLPKIGSTAFFGLVVLGQLLMTAVVDHYGLLGMPVHKVDSYRVIGVMFLLTGCFFIIRK